MKATPTTDAGVNLLWWLKLAEAPKFSGLSYGEDGAEALCKHLITCVEYFLELRAAHGGVAAQHLSPRGAGPEEPGQTLTDIMRGAPRGAGPDSHGHHDRRP